MLFFHSLSSMIQISIFNGISESIAYNKIADHCFSHFIWFLHEKYIFHLFKWKKKMSKEIHKIHFLKAFWCLIVTTTKQILFAFPNRNLTKWRLIENIKSKFFKFSSFFVRHRRLFNVNKEFAILSKIVF